MRAVENVVMASVISYVAVKAEVGIGVGCTTILDIDATAGGLRK